MNHNAAVLRISVVVPAYNESKLIESCLRSIDEAFANAGISARTREIIVVDNASSDDTGARAKAHGVRIVISTDAHAPDQLAYMRHGVAQARRGWLEKGDVVNTRSLAALRKLLQRRKW